MTQTHVAAHGQHVAPALLNKEGPDHKSLHANLVQLRETLQKLSTEVEKKGKKLGETGPQSSPNTPSDPYLLVIKFMAYASEAFNDSDRDLGQIALNINNAINAAQQEEEQQVSQYQQEIDSSSNQITSGDSTNEVSKKQQNVSDISQKLKECQDTFQFLIQYLQGVTSQATSNIDSTSKNTQTLLSSLNATLSQLQQRISGATVRL